MKYFSVIDDSVESNQEQNTVSNTDNPAEQNVDNNQEQVPVVEMQPEVVDNADQISDIEVLQ